MASKKEQILHQFIHSLNKGEKKQLKQYVQRFNPQQDNKILLLFDILNGMPALKTEKIVQAYQDKGYSTKYLAADRNKLFEQILDALISNQGAASGVIKASTSFQKAVLLFEKKFFKLSLQQIASAKKIAYTYESYGILMELLQLEQRALKVLGDFDQLEKVSAELADSAQQQQLLFTLSEINYQATSLRIKIVKARAEKELEQFEQLILRLQKVERNHLIENFYAKFHILETWSSYFYVKDDLEQAMKVNQQLIELMESQDWYLNDQPMNYVAIKTRLLGIQRKLNPANFDHALHQYRQLPKSIQKQRKEIEANVFIFSHNLEMENYLQQQNWQQAVELTTNYKEGFDFFGNLIDPALKVSAYFRMAYANFFLENHETTLDYLLMIVNDYPSELRPDIHHTALLLQIITHYELGNFKLIPYIVNNVKYRIEKQEHLYQTERLLLKAVQKLSKQLNNPEKELATLAKLEEDLNNVQNNEYEQRLYNTFNFSNWIRLKIEKIKNIMQ